MAKLLMINGDRSLARGKQSAFYNTLAELHKHWDRIDIICPHGGVQVRELSLFSNVFVHPSPWALVLQPFWILSKAPQLIRQHKIDVITVQEYPPFYNGASAALLHIFLKIPYMLEIHHVPGLPRSASFKESVYKLWTRLFVAADSWCASVVRVVNKTQVPQFLRKSGVADLKIHYVPSFYIDLEVFKPQDITKDCDLVFAARLEKNKGITLLLKAIEIVKKKKPDVKLLIIGDGSLRQEIEAFIINHNLNSNVEFSGWLATAQDVAHAYQRARAFINPSFNEGGPRVLLEAMACGLPVISTPVGIAVDLIKDGQNGSLCLWEPQAMADKITELLGDRGRQARYSHNGLELVKGFERSHAIANYAQAIKKMIE